MRALLSLFLVGVLFSLPLRGAEVVQSEDKPISKPTKKPNSDATGKPTAKQRLQMEEGLTLEEYSLPVTTLDEVLQKQKNDKPALQYNLETILKETNAERGAVHSVQRSIAEIRASALKNNLSLKIAQADPRIAETRVSEERAKFDNIIYANLKYGQKDLPNTSDDLVAFSSNNALLDKQSVKLTTLNQQTNILDAEVGVAVPLRTGGTIQLSTPLDNVNKANPFGSNQYQSGLRFSVSQPLLRNAGTAVNEASIEIAKFDQQAVEARARLQSIRVLAMIDKAYWELNQAWTELDIRRQQHELASQNLAMVQLRVKEGLSAAIELNRAQFGVTDRLEQVIIASTRLKLAQRQLKFLLNDTAYPIDSDVGFSPSTPPTLLRYQFDREKLLSQATSNRLELLEIELRLAQDATQIDFLENQTLPLFTLDYSYGALSNTAGSFGGAYGSILNGEFNDWYVGFKFEMPVTNEARKARLSRAVAQRLQRLSTKTLQELTVKREINDSLDIVEQHWQRILASRQQVGIAGMNYDAELKQFKEGLRTMTEVLEMLTRLGDSQLKEIRAITDYQIALIDLSFATGTLLGYTNVSFEQNNSRPQ